MQADAQSLETLLAMQKVDLLALQTRKKLQELPQRTKILHVRQKRTELQEKLENVSSMLARAEQRFGQVSEEDGQLAAKARDVQQQIDAMRGDYRSVESRTKELDGIAKRRATLSSDIEKYGGELEKAVSVSDRIKEMIAQIDGQEERLIASFRREGGILQGELARLESQRAKLAAGVPFQLLSAYDKAAARCGGVAIGVLQDGNRCSVCRSSIDESHLLELRSKRPLGECPGCHRLLIVRD